MAENSGISWTHHTFNPWWGCVKISPACANCYAETFSRRTGNEVWGPNAPRRFFGEAHWREPLRWNAAAVAPAIHDGENEGDMSGFERPRVFCASMADVFEDRPDLIPHRARLYNLIRQTPNLDWLLLTKRPENWEKHTEEVYQHWKRSNDSDRHFVDSWIADWQGGNPPPNVWMGATAENQEYTNKRARALQAIPAVVRFLSMEPLLSAVSFALYFGAESLLSGIHWVIVGGESGAATRRPFEVAWLEDIARQCDAAGVALHVKQDTGPKSGAQGRIPDALWNRKEFPKV